MATRTAEDITPNQGRTSYEGIVKIRWAGLLITDDGAPAGFAQSADRSIQVLGTFGAGGTVVIEGSLDGVNWETLTDPQGNNLSFTGTSKKLEAISEMTEFIRPRVTAGDGTTNLTVILLARAD